MTAQMTETCTSGMAGRLDWGRASRRSSGAFNERLNLGRLED